MARSPWRPTRREFLRAAGAASAGVCIAGLVRRSVHASDQPDTADEVARHVVGLFTPLPGDKALLIHTVRDGKPWTTRLDPDRELFCGSAVKVFILTAYLREVEAGKHSLNETMELTDDTRSLVSPILGKQNTGAQITMREALEAMISHSDNTATDMVLRRIGAGPVRALVKEIGLSHTHIPGSTRAMMVEMMGYPKDPGWKTLQAFTKGDAEPPATRNPFTAAQRMSSTCEDFVSFYSRALQGAFFHQAATLAEFRRILTLPDVAKQLAPPGATCYLKGGSLDFEGYNAMAVAGGMQAGNRWTYYSFLLNWRSPAEQRQPTVDAFAKAVAAALRSV